jgi:phage baseplate assembly protein V
MADNIYKILQKANESAQTGDAKMYGVEVAIVTNVVDPDKQGRVKISLPRLPGNPESDWARVALPSAGNKRGFYWLPEVGDEVLVAFERGEASRPYIVGCLWNGKDNPPENAYQDDNTTRMIQTKSGHKIILDDKDGEEKIIIADKSGSRTLTFDVKEKKFIIKADEGDIELHAEKKITLKCEDFELDASGNTTVKCDKNVKITAGMEGELTSSQTMTIKGAKVNIN